MQTEYQVLASTITPCIRNFRFAAAAFGVGCVLNLTNIVMLAATHKVNDKSSKNKIEIAAKVTLTALIIFGTYKAFAYSCFYRNQINVLISKAVKAENGVFTEAKKQFLIRFGWHCTKLLGAETCYLTQQKELMKLIPTVRFFNVKLNVWQFVDPSYALRV